MCSAVLGQVLLPSVTSYSRGHVSVHAVLTQGAAATSAHSVQSHLSPALRAASSQSHLFPGQHSPRFRESRQKTGKTGISRARERVFLVQISFR